MKFKIIEAAVLAAIVVLVSGCDSDCLDFDMQLSKLLGLSHYVICTRDPISGTYNPAEISVGLPGFTTGETYAPGTAFDCGTSTNGQAPLPHMKSAAAIPAPAGGSASGSIVSARLSSTPARPHTAAPAYRSWGYNNGYVPPPIVNPLIPAPVISNGSITLQACSPNSPDVLFVNHLHNSVTRMGTCPFSTKAVIPVASRPLQVAVTPDGTTAVVTSFDNGVNFIDLATNAAFTMETSSAVNPAGVAISPDGRRAYVSSFNDTDSVILVIDIASRKITATIPALAWPQGIYVTPDGSQLWVSYPFEDSIDIFDTLTNTEVARRAITAPSGMAFNTTGTRAYIAGGFGPGTLAAFDTAALKQLALYNVGSYPVDVSVIGDGRYVLVNNFSSANQSLVDTATGTVVTGQPGNGATSANGLVPVQ